MSNFWKLHIIIWSIFSLFNGLVQLAVAGFSIEVTVLALISGAFGCATTWGFREVVKKYRWEDWTPSQLILPLIAGVVTTAFIWSSLTLSIGGVLYQLISGSDYPFTISHLFINWINMGLVVMIWSLMYFSYVLFKKYQRAEIEKWKLQAAAREAELNLLKSQINPHFLFNALNNIRALILEDPTKARKMLTNLSDIFRYSINYTKDQKVSLGSEIEIVQHYIELASIQYEDKLQYQMKVDPSLYSLSIPPMLIQLLVENAIKHGIARLPEGGDVEVKASQQGQQLLIEVRNSGSLFSSSKTTEPSTGIGLDNIRERLQLLYDSQAKLGLRQDEEMVVAEVRIPL